MTQFQEYVLPPRPWQAKEMAEHADEEGWCIFAEQRTGKTKVVIDQGVRAIRLGECQGWIVLAGGDSLARNWVRAEMPKHCPADVLTRTKMHVWSTAKKNTKAHKQAVEELKAHALAGKPIMLSLTYDALLTADCAELVKLLLTEYPLYFVGDETARIKNPKALRTKYMQAAGKLAFRRRALTGTPILTRPFDVYSQVEFACPGFWRQELGVGSAYAFKHRFGVWRQRKLAGGRSFEELQGYRDLDVLQRCLDKVSTRVRRDWVGKDYKVVSFELSDEQRKAYDKLEREYFVEEQEATVTADLAIVRMLRLQQITCGYLPVTNEDGETTGVVPFKNNPRLQLLLDLLEDETRKTIVWARFTQDIDLIVEALRKMHGDDAVVRHDGKTDEAERAHAVQAFQHGAAQFFVATAATAGEGLTLDAGRHEVYYSNSYKLGERLQSEDRPCAEGHSVDVTDLVAEETLDMAILDNLYRKQQVSAQTLGEEMRRWTQGGQSTLDLPVPTR